LLLLAAAAPCSFLLLVLALLCCTICPLQRSIALPDVHSGYGFAIGNVAAFDMNNPEVRNGAWSPLEQYDCNGSSIWLCRGCAVGVGNAHVDAAAPDICHALPLIICCLVLTCARTGWIASKPSTVAMRTTCPPTLLLLCCCPPGCGVSWWCWV
jgi:hypothetical protein